MADTKSATIPTFASVGLPGNSARMKPEGSTAVRAIRFPSRSTNNTRSTSAALAFTASRSSSTEERIFNDG